MAYERTGLEYADLMFRGATFEYADEFSMRNIRAPEPRQMEALKRGVLRCSLSGCTDKAETLRGSRSGYVPICTCHAGARRRPNWRELYHEIITAAHE